MSEGGKRRVGDIRISEGVRVGYIRISEGVRVTLIYLKGVRVGDRRKSEGGYGSR